MMWCTVNQCIVFQSQTISISTKHNGKSSSRTYRLCFMDGDFSVQIYIPFTLNGDVHGEDGRYATHRPSPLISYECYLCD